MTDSFVPIEHSQPNNQEEVLIKSISGRVFWGCLIDGEWFEIVDICEYIELEGEDLPTAWTRDSEGLEANNRYFEVDIYNPPYERKLVLEEK